MRFSDLTTVHLTVLAGGSNKINYLPIWQPQHRDHALQSMVSQ